MTKNPLFQESFLISGVMCLQKCGTFLHDQLNTCVMNLINEKILPEDAELIVDAEPYGLGLHQLTVSIVSSENHPANSALISSAIKKGISFDVIDEQGEQHNKSGKNKNWINVLINLLSMGLVLALSFTVPPSLFLTTSLTTLTFLSTLFTSREYLFTFVHNIRTRNFANMASTVSLGWLLSMTHTFFS